MLPEPARPPRRSWWAVVALFVGIGVAAGALALRMTEVSDETPAATVDAATPRVVAVAAHTRHSKHTGRSKRTPMRAAANGTRHDATASRPDASPTTRDSAAAPESDDDDDDDDTPTQIPLELARGRDKAEVVVLSVPAGADVYFGDTMLGQTPLKVSSTHASKLSIRHKGYRTSLLDVPDKATGILAVQLIAESKARAAPSRPRPHHRRIHSLSKLSKLSRKGKLSRARYLRLRRRIERQRQQRLHYLRRLYRSKKLSRSQYRRYRRAVARYYR